MKKIMKCKIASCKKIGMRCSRGFTIVELLVAMAVIIILFAIVVSMIRQSGNSAKFTQDAANLREIGRAIQLYTNEWSIYPGAGFARVGRVRENVVISSSFDNSPNSIGIHLAEKIYPFLQTSNVFVSPVVGSEVAVSEHYRHNRIVFGYTRFGDYPLSIYDERISDKSRIWAISTTDSKVILPPPSSEPPISNRRNYLFLDGSVQRFDIDETNWDPF